MVRPASKQTCHIVLVDDHLQIRKEIRDFLAGFEGIQIIGEAGNGKEAVDLLASCRPDVVVMDLNMPKMNGIEATNMIKKLWPEVVIIGLYIAQDSYATNAFLKAGAVALISKDDAFDNLYSTIQRACANLVTMPSPGEVA